MVYIYDESGNFKGNVAVEFDNFTPKDCSFWDVGMIIVNDARDKAKVNDCEKILTKPYAHFYDILDLQRLNWKTSLSLNEEVEYFKFLIIEKTKNIEVQKNAGFSNLSDEIELKKLKEIHLEKSHELALEIENGLK